MRTLGFLKMCKDVVKGLDQQSLSAAIDRYQVLSERSWEIINISWNDPSRTEPDAQKAQMIKNILIRCNEIFLDAVTNIKKAIGFTL